METRVSCTVWASNALLGAASPRFCHRADALAIEVHLNLSADSAVEKHIKDQRTRFAEERGKYQELVAQVAEDKKRAELHEERPNLEEERGKADLLHEDSSTSREVVARFVWKRRLGQGSYGEVDEVRELSTGAMYARKHIHLDAKKSREIIANEVLNEVAIMQKLRHLHIATVLFYLKDDSDQTYSIFMLPVADYHLGDYLQDCVDKGFDSNLIEEIIHWFGCLSDALAYAHKLEIKHQDIKPSNILIKEKKPYLADFGLAKDFVDSDASKSDGVKVVGSPLYRAPEVSPGVQRSRKADVFALGCVFSEMLTVYSRKTLEEYRDARRVGLSSVFRDGLDKVRDWVAKLETDDKSDLRHTVIVVTLGMLEEKESQRWNSAKALYRLKEFRTLFCVEF